MAKNHHQVLTNNPKPNDHVCILIHVLTSLPSPIRSTIQLLQHMETITRQNNEIIYTSKLPDIDIPKHLSLHSYCFENISRFISSPCLINGATGKIYTYAEVKLISRKVASGLNKLGIQQGEVIMLLLPNSSEFVFSFLGVSFCGAIVTAANPFYTPDEISKQAKASNARLIITQSGYYEKVKDLVMLENFSS